MSMLHKMKINRNAITVATTFEGEQVVVYHSGFNTVVTIADHEGIFTLENFYRKSLTYINNDLNLFDIELHY